MEFPPESALYSIKSLTDVSRTLQEAGVNFFGMLPCEKVAGLYRQISRDFRHVYLSREEEGVGICGGAYLAGAKPAMLIQSTGLGNMINALCSLTRTYEMPLLILASWRGVYQERIVAQIPLGRCLPALLDALSIGYTIVRKTDDLSSLGGIANDVYKRRAIHVVLLSPEMPVKERSSGFVSVTMKRHDEGDAKSKVRSKPLSTRFEVMKAVAPYLNGKIVVSNLGVPSKELFATKHQSSNFYMLGSMGLASSIALGVSLFTSKQVVAVEGDGSMLMNLGSLSTIARERPPNLTILAIDNGAHGSTGNQPTATSCCANLEEIARGSGFERTFGEVEPHRLLSTLQNLRGGPNFVHVRVKPWNADVPDVPLTPHEIKESVMEVLAARRG